MNWNGDSKPRSFFDLIDQDLGPNPCYVEPGILIKRGTLLFGGHAKSGKSFLGLEMARALASGFSPFDYKEFTIPVQVKVLFIEQELGEYGLKKRLDKLYEKEDRENFEDRLQYLSKDPQLKLDTMKGVETICRKIEDCQPNVVIFDPAGKMHSLDENSNSDMEKLFYNIEWIKDKYKSLDLSVIMSHHFGKPPFIPPGQQSTHDPLSPYNFRGASKWFDAPDTLVTMIKTRNLNTEHKAWELKTRWTLRHDEEPPDMVLSVNRLDDLRVRYERKGGSLPSLEIVKKATG